ncbi:MAG: HutD family protein [Burkholderiales bacterium PBB1]|nr:MAG: HutD family protein [Burkholderiales bacterium PBB1]
MAWRAVALDALPDEPWRNGGGRTRTITAQPRAAGDPPWDWRISVATIEQSAAFSAFPGVDRASLLLGSGSLELSADGEPTVRLHQPGDVAVYRGDAHWQAEIRRFGPPLSLLNAMTRRGAACGRVRAVRDDAVVSGHALAVVVVDGVWRLTDAPSGDAVVLSAGCCAVRDGAAGRASACSRIERVSGAGWLAAVSIARV